VKTYSRIFMSVLLFAALAATLVACGGGSDDGSGSGSSASAATTPSGPKPTKSQITLGMANATTGVADGAQSKSNEAVGKAWVKWVNNDMGGVNGHPVKLVIKDTKDDTATAAQAAKSIIADPKIVAEIGGVDTVSGAVWIKALSDAKVPVIGGGDNNDPTITSNPYFFSLDVAAGTIIPLMADAAKAAGAGSIGMVLCAESAGCKGAADLLKPRVAKLGMKWAGFVGVRATDPNYTAACLAMKQAKAGFVQLAVPSATGTRVIADCQRQGVQFANYGTAYGGFDGDKLKQHTDAGVKVTGEFAGFPWFADTPWAKAFRDAMDKYGDGAPHQNDNQTMTWAALEMFRKAMANVGDSPTRADVAKAMWSIKDEDLGGMLPSPVTFTEGKASPLLDCGWTASLSKGRYTGLKKLCLGS
jgi:branched-chain amino acid transport system substrate-binding protein